MYGSGLGRSGVQDAREEILQKRIEEDNQIEGDAGEKRRVKTQIENKTKSKKNKRKKERKTTHMYTVFGKFSR